MRAASFDRASLCFEGVTYWTRSSCSVIRSVIVGWLWPALAQYSIDMKSRYSSPLSSYTYEPSPSTIVGRSPPSYQWGIDADGRSSCSLAM